MKVTRPLVNQNKTSLANVEDKSGKLGVLKTKLSVTLTIIDMG